MAIEPAKPLLTQGATRGHPDQLVRGRLLDIDLLHVFVTVVLCGSVTSAAQVLNRTQAAVSMQIKRLEEIARAQLLTRSSRGTEVTAKGHTLFLYARKMLTLNEEAMLSLHTEAVAGPVRIGTYHHFAAEILPAILTKFARIFPDVWIEVHVGLLTSLSGRLGTEFDLVVGVDDHVPEGGTVLRNEAVGWYGAIDHEAHLRDPLPIAVLPEGSLFRRWAIESLSRCRRNWRIAQVCTSAAVIESAVAAGLAVAVFKEGTITSSSIQALGEADGFPVLPSVNVTIQSSPGNLSNAAKKLRDFITLEFGASAALEEANYNDQQG